MTARNYLWIVLLFGLLGACQSDKKPVKNPSVAMAGVQHYICPNNCAGSGSDQTGKCPVCGTPYLHNAAFHQQPGATNNNLPTENAPVIAQPQPMTPEAAPQEQAPPKNEPAQNAAGVWHFVCSKGCSGGSGKRGYCPKCGAGMNHNDAYHQPQN